MGINRRILVSSMMSTLVAAPLIARPAASAAESVLANTRSGPVRGIRVTGINTFKGIPYGANTGGEGRFFRPRPPIPWQQARDAFEYGPACAQSDPSSPHRRIREPESEDCLTLNVWTPALRDGGKRPVMVWFHGGGLWRLSAAGDSQAGHHISRRGNVVMVSPNHRIGVFGFASLEELAPDTFPAASHLGMFDLAIIQSGPMPLSLSRSYARSLGERLLGKLAIPPAQARRIQTLTTQEVLKGYYALFHEMGGFGVLGIVQDFAPVVGGVNLPQEPFWYGAPESSARVPLLIGSTRTEMTEYTLDSDPEASRRDYEQIEAKLARLFGADASGIVSGYRQRHPGASAWEVYSLILSDWPTRLFSIRIADAKVRQGMAPVFVYRMDWKTRERDGLLMSPHAIDIPFALDTTDAEPGAISQSDERRHMAAQMSEAWIAFARRGNPQHPGIPKWPRYDFDHRPTMLFNISSRVDGNPDGADLQALQKNLPSYTVVAGGVVRAGVNVRRG